MVAQHSPSGPREIRRYVDSGVEKIFHVRAGEAVVKPVLVQVPNHGEALVAARLFGQSTNRSLVVSGIAKQLWNGVVIGERHQIEFDGVKRSHEHTMQLCSRFAVQGEVEIVLMDAQESMHWPDQLIGGRALNESALLVSEFLNLPDYHDLLNPSSRAMSQLIEVVDLKQNEIFVDDAMYYAVMRNSGHWPPIGT